MLRRAALVLAVAACALVGTSAATAANAKGNGIDDWLPTITICHKPNKDGGTTMQVNLLALFGHLLHGDSLGACKAPPVDEDEGDDDEQPEEPETCEEPGGCDEPETCEEQQSCEEQESCEVENTCEEQETCEEETCEEQEEHTPTAPVLSSAPVAPPAESRSLFCSTSGSVDRGNGDAPGVALNLPDGEGALLVEQGLATPAIFYAGLGVSCDLLPGYVYAGYWVDHIGDQVPTDVGVYPFYVPAS